VSGLPIDSIQQLNASNLDIEIGGNDLELALFDEVCEHR
jgi:hypothetical protein